MVKWRFSCVSAVLILSLAGCQTSDKYTIPVDPVSLDDAKALSVDLGTRKQPPPPPRALGWTRRGYDDLPTAFPAQCIQVRDRRAEDERELVASFSRKDETTVRYWGTSVATAAEQQFKRGRIRYALDLATDAHRRSDPHQGVNARVGSAHGALATAMVAGRLYAKLGDADQSRTWFSRGERVLATSRWGGLPMANTDFGKLFLELRHATLARLDNKPLEEEAYLARLSEQANAPYFGNAYYHVDKDEIAALYASNLLRQGRFVEAEAVAIREVDRAKTSLLETAPLSFRMLAEALFAQRRLDDAAFAARTAIRLHYKNCSEPDGFSIVEAYRTLLKMLSAQGDWNEILVVRSAIRDSLAADRSRFAALFAGNPDILLARAFRGSDPSLLSDIDRAARALPEDGDTAAAARRELELVRGIALDRAGRPDDAMRAFRGSILAVLETAHGDNSTTKAGGGEGRAEFFRRAYLAFLSSQAGAAAARRAGLDPTEELFRVATTVPAGRVQKSFVASAARAAARDPELAGLVRQTQDLEEQILGTIDTLAFLSTAPTGEVAPAQHRSLRREAIRLTRAKALLEQEILARFPDYADLIRPKTPTIGQLRQELGPDEAAIVIRTTDDRSHVWAIPGNPAGAATVSYAAVGLGAVDLQARVDTLRRALDPTGARTLADIPAFDLDLAHGLYRELLQPVSDGWKQAKSLLIVVHGPLGHLPFSLLPTAPAVRKDDGNLPFSGYRQVPWLARTHAVTVLPSIASLQALRSAAEATPKRKPFAGFGDPVFDAKQGGGRQPSPVTSGTAVPPTRGVPIALRSQPRTRGLTSASLAALPQLPDTRREIQAIASVLGATPGQDVFLGPDANEARVKSQNLSDYAVLSFATHGLVPGDLDGLNQPALALSAPGVTGDQDSDGLLTLGEVLGLRLNADWVVLSACNTAAGDGRGSEAISGLGRAFFYAGTRSLLVSYWPVHSAATTELMTVLFQRYARDRGANRAEALRQTRLDLIDRGLFRGADGQPLFSYAHPLFWAPFAIVGDSGSR